MLFFRSEEHLRRWEGFQEKQKGGIIALSDLMRLFSRPYFTNRTRPDYVSNMREYMADMLATLETLENAGDSTWPWAWCAHPLIAVERGMRIALPAGLEFRVADSKRLNLGAPDSEFTWPRLPLGDGREIDLEASYDSGSEPDRFAAKLH